MSESLKLHCQTRYSSSLYVIFHKRVRVYYQGLQTRENNENRSGDGPSDFRCTRVFLKHEWTMKITRPSGRVIFIVHEFYCSRKFWVIAFSFYARSRNIGGPIPTLALTNSLDDNEKHANMHNSLEAQLQEYQEKHTLLFEHKRLAKNTQSPKTKRVKLDHGFDNNRKTKSNAASSANQPHRNSEAKHQQQQRRQPRKQHNRRHKFTRNRYGESSENDNNNTNNKNNGNSRKCDGISRNSNEIMYQPP